MEPVTMAAIGFGLQAASSLMEGFLGSRQKKNEEAIAKYNAEVAKQQAGMVRIRTKFVQARQAEQAARIQGQLEAEMGGAGIVTTEGAPMLSLALQKSELDLENFLIGLEGETQAQQLESQAEEFLMAGRMAKTGARQALISGFLGAGASAIMAWSAIPKTQSQPKYGSMGYALQRGGTGYHMP